MVGTKFPENSFSPFFLHMNAVPATTTTEMQKLNLINRVISCRKYTLIWAHLSAVKSLCRLTSGNYSLFFNCCFMKLVESGNQYTHTPVGLSIRSKSLSAIENIAFHSIIFAVYQTVYHLNAMCGRGRAFSIHIYDTIKHNKLTLFELMLGFGSIKPNIWRVSNKILN